jgi:hypothetical protein
VILGLPLRSVRAWMILVLSSTTRIQRSLTILWRAMAAMACRPKIVSLLGPEMVGTELNQQCDDGGKLTEANSSFIKHGDKGSLARRREITLERIPPSLNLRADEPWKLQNEELELAKEGESIIEQGLETPAKRRRME